MAQALLASPSMWSPPSSPVPSSPGSPQLPALASPFSPHSTARYDTAPDETPTKSSTGAWDAALHQTPSWMTDELDEEWIDHQLAEGADGGEETPESGDSDNEQDATESSVLMDLVDEEQDEDDEDEDSDFTDNRSSREGSPGVQQLFGAVIGTPLHRLQDLNKPRVPSSLRFAFSTASTNTTSSSFDLTAISDTPPPFSLTESTSSRADDPAKDSVGGSPSSSNGADGGTFVVHSRAELADGESQLQAAVRALKAGPAHGGLGAEDVENGEFVAPPLGKASSTPSGNRPGLRRMFDPPTPPQSISLPESSLSSAPTLQSFDFIPPPPTSPRKTWKQIPHFSPSSSSPSELTPRPSKAQRDIPELKPKTRVLRSEAVQSLSQSHSDTVTDSHDSAPPRNSERPATPPRNSHLATPGTPTSALRLFEFKYDTFTRDHLAALVDEIDDLHSREGTPEAAYRPPRFRSEEPERAFAEVEHVFDAEEGDEVSEGEEEGRGRASKRIRISPDVSPASSSITLQPNSRARSRISDSLVVTSSSSSHRRSLPFSSPAAASRARRSSPASFRKYRASPTPPPSSRHQREPHYDIWHLAASVKSASPVLERNRSATSLAFARDREGSMVQLLDGGLDSPLNRRGIEPSSGGSSPCPEPSQPIVDRVGEAAVTTRDRLSEANALLNEIRARTMKKEEERAEKARSASPTKQQSRSILATPSSRTTDPESHATPRALFSEDEADIMERLQAKAQASLRTALSGSQLSRSIAPVASSSGTFNILPSALDASTPGSKRHFARTPVGSISFPAALGASASSLFPSNSTTTPSTRHHTRRSSITTIKPGDVGTLLASVGGGTGKMVFDPAAGRWIKSSRTPRASISSAGAFDEALERSESTEEDPFRDFDNTSMMNGGLSGLGDGLNGLGISTRSASSDGGGDPTSMQATQLVPPNEDGDSAGWTAAHDHLSEEDNPPTTSTMASARTGDATDTGNFREESPFHLFQAIQSSSPQNVAPDQSAEEPPAILATLLPPDIAEPLQIYTVDTPRGHNLPVTPRPALTPQPPRSVLKNATPLPGRSQSAPAGLSSTPIGAASGSEPRPPRSVSFTDGRDSGPIEGVGVRARLLPQVASAGLGSRLKFEVGSSMGFLGEPGSLELLDEDSVELDTSTEGSLMGSPTTLVRSSGGGAKLDLALQELQLAGRDLTISPASSPETSVVIGSFESAPKVRPKGSRSTTASNSRTFRRTTSVDATFMTECSFGVSRDKIVQYIMDVQPCEPDWESLKTINLSNKGAESMIRLKDFLPNLDEADLSHNELGFLTGVPSTIRLLLLSNNKLSSLTSFGHLRNLERLDISRNQIESVDQFACLVHLRELKADYNRIVDLGGLADLDGLVKVSLKGNGIESLDLSVTKWKRLETLNLGHNNLSMLIGLIHVPNLLSLNLDHNALTSFAPTTSVSHLRILRICANPLRNLDIGFAPRLRTLFVDSARLGLLEGTEKLRKLENLSVRDQVGGALALSMPSIRDVRRLYLSGNPLPSFFPSGEKFFNLVYLELALCGLTSLPANLAQLIPNVRLLNLNFNFLDNLDSLNGLGRLEKLEAVGNRLSGYRQVAQALNGMEELTELDMRMNPLTLAFYPPLVVPPSSTTPPHSEYLIIRPSVSHAALEPSADHWTALDSKFRHALPDQFYVKRMSYRALVLKTCPRVAKLDGLGVGRKDRARLAKALGSLETRE